MKTKELLSLLKSKNIKIDEFRVSYIIPTIRIENSIEIVDSFEIKFERNNKKE